MSLTRSIFKPAAVLYAAYCSFGANAENNNLDVKLRTGIFRGVSTVNGTETFFGIPFALAPVDSLRFKAPVAITTLSSAVKDASKFGNACPQPPSSNLGAPISEDCLFLNIWRPQNVAKNAKIPVLFWIHGGAFTLNSASTPPTDPTELIQRSVAIGKPIMVVAANYRLNTFGFLASATMPAEDLNAGLQDQRQALIFVQDNISAFGGDPEKVTIWGQSAGAGSVEAHFLYPAERSLFRAGIADSSTGPFKTSPDAATYDKPGKPFAHLLDATGCSAGKSALSCLQKVPYDTLLSISNDMIASTLNGQVWQPAVGPLGSFVPKRASQVIESGNFLHLPYIGGTNVNEGTFFSGSVRSLGLSGAAETAAFVNYMGHILIDNSTLSRDVINKFLEIFPANDPSLGAPFNTGDSLFDRVAAWYTDEMFLSARRSFFQRASAFQPMFAYYFREFIPGNPIAQGVTHASELELLFGPISPVASVEINFAMKYRDFYVNFVSDLNPGSEWPAYNANDPKVIQLLRNNITLIPDDWESETINFMNSEKVMSEFEK